MILVKKVLEASQVYVPKTAESVWVTMKLAGSLHYFASWDRPPATPVDQINSIKEQMDAMRTNHKINKPVSLHILGDFNFSAIDSNTKLNKFSGKSLSDGEG